MSGYRTFEWQDRQFMRYPDGDVWECFRDAERKLVVDPRPHNKERQTMSDTREVERRECPRCESVQNFAWRTNRQPSRTMGTMETKSLNCQTCGWAANVTDPVHV